MRRFLAAGLVATAGHARRWVAVAEEEAAAAERAAELAGPRSAAALRRAAGVLRSQGHLVALVVLMLGRELRGEEVDAPTDPGVTTRP